MAILKKALYIRLLLAAIIILSVLFIDMTSSMMILLLVLSSLLSLIEFFFELYTDIKNKKYFSTKIIIISVIFVSFISNHEYEAAIFSLLYALFDILIGKIESRFIKKEIDSIADVRDREDMADVLSYSEATDFHTEEVLRSSVFLPLIGVILISIFSFILLCWIGHFNTRTSAYRSLIILYLSTSEPLFTSMRLIGTYGLCECCKFGLLFNCADNVEQLNYQGVLKNRTDSILPQKQDSVLFFSSIDPDTFKNIVLHIISQSNREEYDEIKKNISFDVDVSLINEFNDYGSGIVCKINEMPVYFGKKGFIHSLGLSAPNESNADDYFLFMSDRFIGSVRKYATNVSDSNPSITIISNRIGESAKKNVFIGFILKAVLITLSILGFMKLWIALLIETLIQLFELYNVHRMMT